MDDIDAICPGECHFSINLDSDLNKQYKTDCYYKPKVKFDENLPEHIMATEYSNTLKNCMQEAMKETFDLIDSEIPALSTVTSNMYWEH